MAEDAALTVIHNKVVTMNHFEIFGFDPSYDLDESSLLARYFDLQKKNQDDGNLLKTLNAAFEILKDPLKRAEYFLSLEYPDATNEVPENVTMEMFEIREEFAKINSKSKREDFLQDLEKKKNDLLDQMHNIEREKFWELYCFAKFLDSFIKQVEDNVEHRN